MGRTPLMIWSKEFVGPDLKTSILCFINSLHYRFQNFTTPQTSQLLGLHISPLFSKHSWEKRRQKQWLQIEILLCCGSSWKCFYRWTSIWMQHGQIVTVVRIDILWSHICNVMELFLIIISLSSIIYIILSSSCACHIGSVVLMFSCYCLFCDYCFC